MSSSARGKRTAGYTVHIHEWPEAWKVDGTDEDFSASTLDYALIVAKRLQKTLVSTMPSVTTVRLDGKIVAKVDTSGMVNLVQPPKPSAVLP